MVRVRRFINDVRVPTILRGRLLPVHPSNPIIRTGGDGAGEIWTGVGWVSLAMTVPAGEADICLVCWCNMQRNSIDTCLGPNFEQCFCRHFRCRSCGVVRSDYNDNTHGCNACVVDGGHPESVTLEAEDALTIRQQQRHNEWDGCGEPAMVLPFRYAPTHLTQNNNTYSIRMTMADRMVREVRLGLYGNISPIDGSMTVTNAILFEGEWNFVFHHYHTGCWGSINIRLNGEETSETLRDRLQRSLSLINGESLAEENPMTEYGEVLPSLVAVRRAALTSQTQPLSWDMNSPELARIRRFNRQRQLGLVVPDRVWVIGIGGIGWNLARLLVLVGVRELTLADHDVIDEHNLNRIDAHTYVGSGKVGTFIHRFGRGANLSINAMSTAAEHHGLTIVWRSQADVYGPPDVVVDCTDQLLAQNVHYTVCRELFPDARYVRAGYDGGWHVMITSQQPIHPSWDFNPAVGYAVPSWVGGADMAANLALLKVVYQPELEYNGDIRDMVGINVPQ